MKQYSDTISVELTFSEILKMTARAIFRADEIVRSHGPISMLEEYVNLAKKLNDILKHNGFNHYTDEKFQDYIFYINKRNGCSVNKRDCKQ